MAKGKPNFTHMTKDHYRITSWYHYDQISKGKLKTKQTFHTSRCQLTNSLLQDIADAINIYEKTTHSGL